MNNSDMPINQLQHMDGSIADLTDGTVDDGYFSQEGRMFAIGITKREHFAGLAMQSIDPPKDYVGISETAESYLKWRKKVAKMADELLKELDK